VLNDGSKDDTLAVVQRYASDPRIRIFDQPNIGQVGRFDLVWQSLVPHARGDFIASVDGDDVSMPDHFERMLRVFAEDDRVGLVHSAGMRIDEHSKLQGPAFVLNYSYDETSQLREFMYSCLVAHSTILMRRDAFETVGWFEDGFATDYQYWMKLAKHYRFRYLPEALIHYRVHSGGSSRQAWSDEGARTRRWERIRSSMLDLYPSLSGSTDAKDYAAAHVDLGLRMIRGLFDFELAMDEFAHAVELMGGECPEAEWNQMLLLGHVGREDEANRLIVDFRLKHPDVMRRYMTRAGEGNFAEGDALSNVPFTLPQALHASARCWDGTRAALRRLMLYPDHDRPELTQAVVSGFVQSASMNTDEIDLCVATLGVSEKEMSNTIQSALPVGHVPEDRRSVTVTRVDDSSFAPAHRFAGVLDLRNIKTEALAKEALADSVQKT
jgi:hypothetical protein